MTNKVIAMIIGQNCEQTIEMCLESVKDADTIIYCDGGSTDGTLDYLDKKGFCWRVWKNNSWEVRTKSGNEVFVQDYGIIIENKWDPKDKQMNGKQRNFYLDYLKKNYLNEWCIVLDADEVLEDFGIQKMRQFIDTQSEIDNVLVSPRIHHFVGDLGHEDATRELHYVPNRLFKITKTLSYPLGAHPVLKGAEKMGRIDIHIWHFRECLGVFNTNKKHIDNWKKSEMHSKGYLMWWYYTMLFGSYPKKSVYYGDIPSPIKRRFEI